MNYVVGLSTTRARFEKDLARFRTILRTFRVTTDRGGAGRESR
jgi:hypothetical protein